MAIFILGRQSGIALAELESLYGSDNVTPVSDVAAFVDAPQESLDFKRVGSSIKLCSQIGQINSNNIDVIAKHLFETIPTFLQNQKEGKIKIGISVYGNDKISPKRIQAIALQLKKILKQKGHSIRIIPNKTSTLNAAQILHNKLTDDLGLEINIIFNNSQTVIGRTLAVQDIDAYAARDHGRPKRDARVGMLPPKLAQTIVNLSGAEEFGQVLDPFCGTGVVLQEALLMGIDTYGSDLDERMVEYTKLNIEWLAKRFDVAHGGPLSMWYSVEQADATNFTLPNKHTTPIKFIACETYLGRPFSSLPRAEILQKVIQDVDTIHRKFLQNIAKQTKPGFRMCIAVPAWNNNNRFLHLKTLDSLEELGYNRVSFAHANDQELIYYRSGQVVGRELVTLIRK